MDQESYEQVPINAKTLPDSFKFVKEQTICKVCSYKGTDFTVEPPKNITLEVTHTEPGVRGDTATNTQKPATLETGAEVRVPLFINEGDKIIIDTETGKYSARA
jgi:elongation factor P